MNSQTSQTITMVSTNSYTFSMRQLLNYKFREPNAASTACRCAFQKFRVFSYVGGAFGVVLRLAAITGDRADQII